ncbi:alpha/beta hydrolase [Sphingomonas sp. BGYR3]|uniref:alpha/beta hydrolase n=1 Tax=Sphingomonas sp. BGYR3 TaxID=2975483 RepID=UPI0021A4E1C1|nr:alpha/beta hydrolase [Sphingomonas sp. BGYR3]MDG5488776.1 alpha/beta hydrolase [Sphingomonas sp. BGYR3]
MTDARIAFFHRPGTGPTIVFLPGYASDMTGAKAVAIERWAMARGQAVLRFDYRGCGASEGAFEDFTLADWRDDVLMMIDRVATGPVILVGSSMGGWLALLAARERANRVAGMVLIAPAPDFTDWGFSQDEKLTLLQEGRVERPSPYSPQPTVFTRAFWSSGEANRITHGTIPVDCPVRIVQGQADPDVPWERAVHLAGQLRSAEVQTWLIKNGDHRLSRDSDIAMICRAIEDVSNPR